MALRPHAARRPGYCLLPPQFDLSTEKVSRGPTTYPPLWIPRLPSGVNIQTQEEVGVKLVSSMGAGMGPRSEREPVGSL